MKKLYNILSVALGIDFGILIGVSFCRFMDYKRNPAKYMVMSAPWYTSIQIHAFFTFAIALGLIIAMIIVAKKLETQNTK